jgi:hypothetical protein
MAPLKLLAILLINAVLWGVMILLVLLLYGVIR